MPRRCVSEVPEIISVYQPGPWRKKNIRDEPRILSRVDLLHRACHLRHETHRVHGDGIEPVLRVQTVSEIRPAVPRPYRGGLLLENRLRPGRPIAPSLVEMVFMTSEGRAHMDPYAAQNDPLE